MPLPLVAAIVVYCTTFAALLMAFSLWGTRRPPALAAIVALGPAVLAYIIM